MGPIYPLWPFDGIGYQFINENNGHGDSIMATSYIKVPVDATTQTEHRGVRKLQISKF